MPLVAAIWRAHERSDGSTRKTRSKRHFSSGEVEEEDEKQGGGGEEKDENELCELDMLLAST